MSAINSSNITSLALAKPPANTGSGPGPTCQQAVVGLPPGVAVLAGQDSHWLLVRLPGLGADSEQLTVDLRLGEPRAVAVVNLQLEELHLC